MSVVSIGRFHAFDLARELAEKQLLRVLSTGYWPQQINGIPRRLLDCHPFLFSTHILTGRFGRPFPSNEAVLRAFELSVVRRCEGSPILHFLSGMISGVVRNIEASCGTLVCDRGSTHFRHQARVLENEYAALGMRYGGRDRWIEDRELSDYEVADMIVVPSNFVRDTFVSEGVDAAKVRVVPYGVESPVFLVPRALPRTRTVLFVGIVGIRKGIHYLLECARRPSMRDVTFQLAGTIEPDFRPLLKCLPANVILLGRIPRTELKTYYGSARVFVLPSLEEGLALVIGQAMSAGLPIVCTRETGAEMLARDGREAFIIPSRNVDELESRISKLMDDTTVWGEMSEACKRRIGEIGGWRRYCEEVVQVYEEVG